MRNILRYFGLVIGFSFVLLYSCEKKEVPTLTTVAVTNITGTSATSGGNITSEGSGTVLSRGVCWSTGTNPTVADNKTSDAAGAGIFTSNITGLNGATIYFVRAYATNNAGTGYGMAMSFTTLGLKPSYSGQPETALTTSGVTLNAIINPNYLSTTVTFEYGISVSYGQSITPTQSPVTGNTSTNVSANVSGLTPGTLYHYRIKAVNSLGTSLSDDYTFKTLGEVPTVATLSATSVSFESAKLNGTVNANYLPSNVIFEYGTTSAYGSNVTASQSPINGNVNIPVGANLNGLTAGLTYHFRVKATNSLGTSIGNDMTFVYTISDVDGNIYNIVTIGQQIWMKENLKTTKYRNGNLIGTTAPATLDINSEATPKYQWAYDGNESNVATYGRLYTWYAATDSRNICPTGWHLPSDAEWTTLITFLGGESVAGGKLKEAGMSHWQSPNTGATNETNFTALPGGYRYETSTFNQIGYFGNWWSSTEFAIGNAKDLGMGYDGGATSMSGHGMHDGFSVRCIKDN